MKTNTLDQLDDSGSNCLRCEAPMKKSAVIKMHEGSMAIFGFSSPVTNLLELSTEVCPKCGKVEFYI